MTMLAALPALLFGLAGLTAIAVLAVSGRRAFAAWGELARALKDCGEVRIASIAMIDTGARPHLRLIEGGFRPPVAARCHGLRAAA